MNAAPRARALVAALGALVLLTVGACSSADDDQASTPASTTAASSTAAPSESSAGTSSDTATDTATAEPDSGSLGATAGETATPAPTPDLPTPATTEVTPPGGDGNITETVAEVPRTTNAAVPLTAPADADGVAVSLTGLEKVTTTAELPGEIAGPGLKVTVSLTNGSAAPLDLVNVVVDLQDAAGTPALPMIADPAAPFSGVLDVGATATGVYVFTLPATYTGPASISVSSTTDVPVVVFTGDTP